ncbi:MAG: GGDEF domain-containing protein [Betaproteobacteria bacterium]
MSRSLTLTCREFWRPQLTAGQQLVLAGLAAGVMGTAVVIVTVALAVALFAPAASAADSELVQRAREIEPWLPALPKRALNELAVLSQRSGGASDADRRYVDALQGAAMVSAGKAADALRLADVLERDGTNRHDDATVAAALLLRGGVQQWAGDSKKANALAIEARERAKTSDDLFIRHWAAMAVGIPARQRGRFEEALGSFQEALALADRAQNPYRRAIALYQLSVLNLALKQPERSLAAASEAFAQASLAKSAWAMAKAKMAESAALELLNKPTQELAALREALAIARMAGSGATESLALANLADIYLRRKEFRTVVDLSRRSLELAKEFDDSSLMATSKANMGFALIGLGRTDAGKRLADEALADYERTGRTADIAGVLGEYGQYLEASGDYKAALALLHRQRKLNEEISLATHDKTLLELQSKYEAEKHAREMELLNRDNELKSVELKNRQLQQSVWWLLALGFAVSFAVVAVLYRKLRVTNRLLGQKNLELSFQSSRDPLTMLYNRRYFQDFIDEAGSSDERRRTTPADAVRALLLIDIDHFKLINDRQGHAAGDAVLVVVARRLREALRETDMIVRWGGEEFLVFVPAAPAGQLEEIVSRVMHALGTEPIAYQGRAIRITASVGFTPLRLPPDGVALTWERAISLADMALYMAKLHGRNRAYGIRSLRRSDDEALAMLDRDLEQAWRDGIVDLQVLPGAVTEPSLTVVADNAA